MRYSAKIRICNLVVALIALSLLIPCLALADDGADTSTKENSLQPGSWSLQFQVEDELSIEPFGGFIVAMKRHFSERSALRIGFDLDLNFSDIDDQTDRVYSDTLWSVRNRNTDRDVQQLELDFMYLRYANPDAAIHFFWGAGPLFMFARDKSMIENVYSYSNMREDRNTSETLSRTWAVGSRGLVGIEWFVTRGISLHAEYRAAFRYLHTTNENTQISYRDDDEMARDTGERTTKTWNFDGAHVIMGVSLYF